jgi:hypothetical protein
MLSRYSLDIYLPTEIFMKVLQHLLAAGLFAVFAQQASADQLSDLGTLTLPTSITYGNNYDATATGSIFFDDYYFTIATGSLSAVTSSINLSSILGLSDLRARLYTGNSHITGSAGSALVEAWGSTVNFAHGLNVTSVILNPNTALAAGTYTLQIRGTVSGSSGGSYSGVLNIAQVPEPSTYAMLLCGMAIIGFCTRKQTS